MKQFFFLLQLVVSFRASYSKGDSARKGISHYALDKAVFK